MRPSTRKSKEKYEKGFYAAYASLAQTFRGWLVAYGIGAPVLFLSHDTVMRSVKTMPDASYVVLAYLIGSLLQVSLVWLYKLTMWWAYLEEMDTISEDSARYKFVNWFTNTVWIEGIVDCLTICMFVYATARILLAMAA